MRNVQYVLLVDSKCLSVLVYFLISFLFVFFLVLMSVVWLLSQKNIVDHGLSSFFLLSLLIFIVHLNC